MNIDGITEFNSFVNKVVEPSITDIEGMADASRKHVQKLLYTNIVDRFGSTLDRLFLDNCRQKQLLDIALKNANDPITNAELFALLADAESIEEAVKQRLESGLRQNVLRENHSSKLRTFLRLCAPDADAHVDKPRVKFEGTIVEKFKPQKNSKMPPSIVGFADWLYSRRNSIVHGSGTSSFLEGDKKRLKEKFKTDVTTSRISLSLCKTAVAFYKSLLELVIEAK